MLIKKIKINNTFHLIKTHKILDPKVTKLIAEIYYSKDNFSFNESFEEIFQVMLEEDLFYANDSKAYNLYHRNSLIASIRKIEKTNILIPIEREFGVCLNNTFIDGGGKIFEIARLGSKNKNPLVVTQLFKFLLRDVDFDDILVASLDSKVVESLRKIGFPWKDLGDSKFYLGSITCPVFLKAKDIYGKFALSNLNDSINIEAVING